jgi:hypothetical protein
MTCMYTLLDCHNPVGHREWLDIPFSCFFCNQGIASLSMWYLETILSGLQLFGTKSEHDPYLDLHRNPAGEALFWPRQKPILDTEESDPLPSTRPSGAGVLLESLEHTDTMHHAACTISSRWIAWPIKCEISFRECLVMLGIWWRIIPWVVTGCYWLMTGGQGREGCSLPFSLLSWPHFDFLRSSQSRMGHVMEVKSLEVRLVRSVKDMGTTISGSRNWQSDVAI